MLLAATITIIACGVLDKCVRHGKGAVSLAHYGPLHLVGSLVRCTVRMPFGWSWG